MASLPYLREASIPRFLTSATVGAGAASAETTGGVYSVALDALSGDISLYARNFVSESAECGIQVNHPCHHQNHAAGHGSHAKGHLMPYEHHHHENCNGKNNIHIHEKSLLFALPQKNILRRALINKFPSLSHGHEVTFVIFCKIY